jgi:membrane-bound ClpP family serine protease
VRSRGRRTTLEKENAAELTQNPPKENHLLTVLSIAFVLGMAVAIGVYLAWSHGVLQPAFHSPGSAIALFFCPPFILSIAVGPTADADLALALVISTIVFANAFLYAGAAAGGYFVVNLMRKGSRRQA